MWLLVFLAPSDLAAVFPDVININELGQYTVIKTGRTNGQNINNTQVVITWNDPLSLHEQPEDERTLCSCKVYIQGVNGADHSSVHILLHWLGNSRLHVTALYCRSDLLPVTVLVSRKAGVNCTCPLCRRVASKLYCFCTVWRPSRATGRRLQQCLLSVFGHTVWQCSFCFCCFFMCLVKRKQTELLTGMTSLMHLDSVVSYCLISFTNSHLFPLMASIYGFISVW